MNIQVLEKYNLILKEGREMNYKIMFTNALIFIFVVISFNCNHQPHQIRLISLVSLETPVITGIYVTTNEYPDGTGEVMGNPSYKIKDINVFPNPYSAVVYPAAFINVQEPFFTFNHLPDSVTIVIVKGESKIDAINSGKSNLGMSPFHNYAWKVRTIKKNGGSKFMRWDIKDDEGHNVPSGYYRAYFFGEQVPENYYIDMSLEIIDGKLNNY